MKKTIQVTEPDPQYVMISDIAFSNVPYWYGVTNRPLLMDMIAPRNPPSDARYPVILWMCGGAFSVSDRKVWLPSLMSYINEGYILAFIDYRLSANATYPAAVIDVKSAVRFLRANSERYHIDPDRIIAMGESAGGFLALMSASQNTSLDRGDHMGYSSIPNLIVDLYGVTDFSVTGSDENTNSAIAQFINGMTKDEIYNASPINNVYEGFPPTIIIHGSEDPLVPIKESESLYNVLRSQNVPADFYTIKGRGHGEEAFYHKSIKSIINDFILKHLCICL